MRERTTAERAHARAVREARRKGLPDPPPPSVDPPAAHPPEVEPVAARLPEPEPERQAAPPPEPEPEPVVEPEPPAAAAAPLTWDVTEEWDALEEQPEPEIPEPEAHPQAEPPAPHGDPLEAEIEEPEPAAVGTWQPAPGLAESTGAHRARRANGGGVGRDLPPLPSPTAARQPPQPPPRGRTAPSAPPAPRRRRRWGARALAFGALLVTGFLVTAAVALFQPFHGKAGGDVRLTVPTGSTAREIGDLLAARGVVADGRLFAVRALLAGKRSDFKSGAFTLERDMTYGAAIDALVAAPGAAPTVNVTITEGRARRETAPLVAQAGLKGDYLAATGGDVPRDLGAPRKVRSLEGFLFPATYQLPRRSATAEALVAAQLRAFRANIAKVDMRRAKRKNLTRYDVLTIASMVEREAQLPRERRIIAAVIYNRLHEGIPLGIDATIRYAVHNWSTPLKVSELKVDSPYNLRKHTGLPPTPIGSPGLASIQAAANPAHVKYLYYVVKPGGKGAHAFSSTDAQFQRDVRRYNEARARNGGRSPAG